MSFQTEEIDKKHHAGFNELQAIAIAEVVFHSDQTYRDERQSDGLKCPQI